MQAIAAENNLSESVFFIREDDHYTIRWFIPETEVDLCGHATLAAAWVIHNQLHDHRHLLNFTTQQDGEIRRSANNSDTGVFLQLDFPQRPPTE